MGLSAVTYFVLLCAASGLYVFLTSGDAASCVVVGSSSHALNGYYSAFDGSYHKLGSHIPNGDIPSYYGYIDIHASQSSPDRELRFGGTEWSLWGVMSTSPDSSTPPSPEWRKIAYVRPDHPEEYIHHPPEQGWVASPAGGSEQLARPPRYVYCSGSLDRSASTVVPRGDNIARLTSRPVTTALLVINTLVAYYLWSAKVDVGAVSFSYDAVARGQVWRLITASFSHFDVMHIGFNMMALYQLGDLEYEFGSVRFLYLNLDLVLLTMGICVLIAHIRIVRFNDVDARYQQAVGFSCVLFAWMTVASVRMNEYCPLFFYPSLCFETYHIGVPLLPSLPHLPVNLGPFVLLLVTKVILPRSSFVGHLSGILIGFPLAWNMLNWITVPVLASALVLSYLLTNHLWVGNPPGFESVSISALRDFIPSTQLHQLVLLRWLVVLFVLASLAAFYSFGWADSLPYIRLGCSGLCFVCDHSIRCLWLSDLRDVKKNCAFMVLSAVFLLSVVFLTDLTTLITALVGKDLLIYSCGIGQQKLLIGTVTLIVALLVEAYLLKTYLYVLYLTSDTANLLRPLLLDEEKVLYDMKFVSRVSRSLRVRLCACCGQLFPGRRGGDHSSLASSSSSAAAFSGPSYQLRDASLIRSRTPPRQPATVAVGAATGGGAVGSSDSSSATGGAASNPQASPEGLATRGELSVRQQAAKLLGSLTTQSTTATGANTNTSDSSSSNIYGGGSTGASLSSSASRSQSHQPRVQGDGGSSSSRSYEEEEEEEDYDVEGDGSHVALLRNDQFGAELFAASDAASTHPSFSPPSSSSSASYSALPSAPDH